MGVMPVVCGLCFHGRLWEIVGDFEILCFLKTSQNLSKNPKNSHNTQLHPRRRHAASVNIRYHPYHFRKKKGLCSLQRFCLHEGIGNRSTVSSPHTPQPLRTHFPSGFSATVSSAVYAGCFVGRPTTASGLYRLRPAGLPGRSFHCTPGLCSVFLSRSQK